MNLITCDSDSTSELNGSKWSLLWSQRTLSYVFNLHFADLLAASALQRISDNTIQLYDTHIRGLSANRAYNLSQFLLFILHNRMRYATNIKLLLK